MTTHATISIECAIGYSGHRSTRSYVARITGTSDQYIFAREFLGTEATDRAEMFTARRKGRGTWTEAVAVEPGIYEVSQYGERRYVMVWMREIGAVKCRIDADRVQAIALRLDAGETFEAARLATRTPKQEQPAPEAQ